MSDLIINSVCIKKQIYPMVLDFQNGYPSENFEFDCALIQDEDGNKVIATEFNGLLYAGNEETEALGQTFLLARNRKTGKVRLIEVGCASLKPFSEYQELENSVLEPDEPNNPQLINTNKLNSNRRNHTPENETNYEQVKKHSLVLEPSEREPNELAQNHQLKASELEPKEANTPLLEHNEVEPNRSSQSPETRDLGSFGTKNSLLLEPSALKLKAKEFNLNTRNDNKDFSTEKMMFMRALGLNIKVGETVYSENNVHSSKQTAVDNTFIYNDCGRKSKSKLSRLSLITHVKCNNSDIKAKKKVTLFPHIKLGAKHNKNTQSKEGITLKLPFIKLTKCDLLDHINEKLASEKMYKCTLCKYTTPYASRLTRHKLAHTKSFKCKHCKKGFRKSYDLKVHLRRHTGDRPFQCRCGATFAKRNTLNRHLKTHTGEKPFRCTMCSSKFKLLNGLKRHLKIHGERTFKCTVCESVFSDGSSLNRHIRRHTGQKPYMCDSCKYSTANSHDLKRHAKTCQGRCRRTIGKS